MDWARARNMLLLTFTIVNLTLAYLVWGAGANATLMAAGRWSLRELRDRLERDGILLVASLPPYGPMLPFLRVSPPDREGARQVANLLSTFIRDRDSEPAAAATVEKDGSVRYIPAQPGTEPVNLESTTAVRQAADQFLRFTRLLELADFDLRWSRTYPDGPERMVVEYIQHHQDRALFVGRLVVSVGRNGVEEARAYLPEVQGFRGEPKGVLAPSEALLRLAGHIRALSVPSPAPPAAGAGTADRQSSRLPPPDVGSPDSAQLAEDPRYMQRTPRAPASSNARITLESIELGYYAGPTRDARAWDTVPTWRFLTSTGEVYYINAFTGELENP